MLTKEYQVTIQVLHQQGMSSRAIARELGVARQTVLDTIAGRNDGRYGPRAPKATKLSPYHDYVAQRLLEASPHRLNATVLMRELRERGYDGGISQLKLHLAALRPVATEDPIIRFETDPGQQMQIDFVVFRLGHNPLRAFTASLGYSRMSFVQFTDNERSETWAECLQEAFMTFGGVPKTVLCDNSKSIVIERNAYGQARHRIHPLIWDLAKHYGFRIHLCKPYRAQTKGKVERFHRYFRQSFYIPIQSRLGIIPIDVATANREVQVWLADVANIRNHATLGERPCDRFALEQSSLQPLPLPFAGITVRAMEAAGVPVFQKVPIPTESFQHPLNVYEQLADEIRA
jgi:transposase